MSTPEAQLQTMIRNLEEKSGKPFAEWLKIARAAKLTKVKEILNYLTWLVPMVTRTSWR